MRFFTATGAFRAWWSLAVVLVAAVCVAAGSIVYTNHTQREADRRWCELLSSLDQPQPPPSTARGRQIQDQIHDLREDLGCEEGDD